MNGSSLTVRLLVSLLLALPLQAQLPTSSRPVKTNLPQPQEEQTLLEEEQGQENQQEAANVPAWVLHFTNLSQQEQEQFLHSLQQAKQAYLLQQWAVCYANLNDCEMIFQGNPGVANLKASCLIEMQRYEEAETAIQQSLANNPEDPIALFNRTSILLAHQQYAPCIQELNQLILLLADSDDNATLDVLLFRMFICHLLLGQEKEARESIAYASPLADSPLYYYCQALLNLYQGHDMESTRDFRTVRTLFSKANQAYESELRHSNIISILQGNRGKNP